MKSVYHSLAALLGGAVGWILYRWLLTAGFDAEGLPLSGVVTLAAPAGMIAIAAVMVLLAAPCSWAKRDMSALFSAAPPYAMTAMRLTALPYLAAGVLLVRHLLEQGYESSSMLAVTNAVLPVLLVFCSLLSAVSCGMLPAWTKKGVGAVGPAVLCLTACVWLIQTYHSNANDPVLLHYLCPLLASMASMLAWRFTCSLAYSTPRTRWAQIWSMVAVALSLSAMADPSTAYQLPLLLAQVWWFSWQSWLLARQCRNVPDPKDPSPEA